MSLLTGLLAKLSGLPRWFAVIGITVFAITLTAAQVDFPLMRELALSRYGAYAARVVDDWQERIETMKLLPDEEKLTLANDFFNSRIRGVSDTEAWGEDDYWATPLETIGRGQGDCEDFTIAKYATLVLAGVEISKLRMTYAKLSYKDGRTTPHMVLAYYPSPESDPLILDSAVIEILNGSERTDLEPVYGFNSRGIWVTTSSNPVSTQPEARLSKWRELLSRLSKEGLG